MAAPPKIRPAKNARRRAVVLILVQVLIAVHVAHWMSTGESMSPLEPSEAMEFSKHGIVNAGLIFFALSILSTMVLGRWFCGWACHLVALQDLALWILTRLKIKPRPLRSRVLALVPFLAAVYMFLVPLGYRLWKGADVTATQVELTTEGFWETFPPWPVAVVTLLFCGFGAIYFLGAKGFCTYACPYGAFYFLGDKLAVGRIRVTDACAGCAQCTATCTSNVVVHEEVRDHGMVVDPGCMKTLDCVAACPMNALHFGLGKPSLLVRGKPAARSRGSVTWGEELVLGLAFVAAFLVYRGLYGVIPFLFSLAVAGIVAALFLATARLFYKPNLSVGQWRVRADGHLTGGGRWFVAGIVALATLTVHSGFIQVHARMSRESEGESGLRHAQLVDRFGLLRTPGNTAHIADIQAALGRSDEAIATYGRALEEVASVSLYDRLALLQFRSGRPEEGLATYRQAVAWDPESADLQFQLGVGAATLRQDDEALAAFAAVVELQPERVEAWENLARGLAATGRPEEALAAYEEVLLRKPGDPDTLRALVGTYLALRNPEGARARLQTALEAGEARPEVVQALLQALDPGD